MYPDNWVRGSFVVCYHMLCVLTDLLVYNLFNKLLTYLYVKNYFSLAYPFSMYLFLVWFSFFQWSQTLVTLVWADVEAPSNHHDDGDAIV